MDDEQHGERRDEKNGSRWPIGRRGFAIGATASALGAATLALDAQQSELIGESDEETADWYGETDSEAGQARRREYLKKLIPLLHLDADDDPISDRRLSREYPNWRAWLDDTGELPPTSNGFRRQPVFRIRFAGAKPKKRARSTVSAIGNVSASASARRFNTGPTGVCLRLRATFRRPNFGR